MRICMKDVDNKESKSSVLSRNNDKHTYALHFCSYQAPNKSLKASFIELWIMWVSVFPSGIKKCLYHFLCTISVRGI